MSNRQILNRLYSLLGLPVIFLRLIGISALSGLRGRKLASVTLIEHLGDILACEPVSRALAQEGFDVVWFIKPAYVDAVAFNPSVVYSITLKNLFQWICIKSFASKLTLSIDLHLHGRICSATGARLSNPNNLGITLDNYYDYGSLVGSFTNAANYCADLSPPKFWEDPNGEKIEISKPYVVFHCKSDEPARDWNSKRWEELCVYLEGKGYHVFEIGLSPSFSSRFAWTHKYIGRKPISSLAYIISHASLFIGVDSSMAHIANALEIPSVLIFGKYRRFNRYLPYEGYFKLNAKNIIAWSDGGANFVSLDSVVDLIERSLLNVEIKK